MKIQLKEMPDKAKKDHVLWLNCCAPLNCDGACSKQKLFYSRLLDKRLPIISYK